jgi:ABC-type uncharacterized transport system YnjBCD permease subunit
MIAVALVLLTIGIDVLALLVGLEHGFVAGCKCFIYPWLVIFAVAVGWFIRWPEIDNLYNVEDGYGKEEN